MSSFLDDFIRQLVTSYHTLPYNCGGHGLVRTPFDVVTDCVNATPVDNLTSCMIRAKK